MNDRDGVRRYLLGSASEGERDRFEQDLMADEGLYKELLATEEELIDEYVAGELPELEQTGFLQYLSKLPDYEKRLEFARALRARSLNSQTEVVSSDSHGGFPVRAPWVAAAALLLMAIGGIWSITTISELRRELASNGPRSLVLTAGTLRSGGTMQTVPVPDKPSLVHFHLDLGFDDYENLSRRPLRLASGGIDVSEPVVGTSPRRQNPPGFHGILREAWRRRLLHFSQRR